ncbi:MAG: aspartate/glutamate racemase family protein [Clostridia bacterium]|nr:aspartate/glutamate racemase family protein [Clostridia bacterium]
MNQTPEKEKKTLGILGGLGPMATVYFYELLVRHTSAGRDQDHIDVIISGRATTPDRTAFILGRSGDDPLPVMAEELLRLENAGADIVVMPCNTAHYFYDELARRARVPMLDIIHETLARCASLGMKRIGLLATEGTVRSGSYQKRAEPLGLEIAVPPESDQSVISEQIYGRIKKNLAPDAGAVISAAEKLRRSGCDTVVLGCTELSLMRKDALSGDTRFTDSMEALARAAILACGKEPLGL